MKKIVIITLTTLLCVFSKTTLGQEEFKTSSKGLIYSDSTMSRLKHIVDTLNLKFKVCNLTKTYLSKPQAKAHFVILDTGNIKHAKKDMENNMSFDEFMNKYPLARVDSSLLIVKYLYKNYENNNVVSFNSFLDENEIEIENNAKLYDTPLKNKWVIDYWEKSTYSEESVRGFFFINDFELHSITEPYARMIQYSDCMVDTSTQIFYEDAKRTGVRYNKKEPANLEKFMDYIHKETKMPKRDGDDYWTKYQTWDSLRIPYIDSVLQKEEKFKKLLLAAVNDAISQGGSSDEFEEYVGRYYSRETELKLKRNRIVVGGCSMDNSPRVHAMNIAVLSAETINWEIFLRAHLDIMNDRFERASDGSYAWGARKTYIKELEELDINVRDLILGISLRIENPSENHYYGNIQRLGRALAETKYANEIEVKMLSMIKDSSLDDFNRLVIYFLYRNYIYFLEDKEQKVENVERLKNAIKGLPTYLSQRININE